MFPKKVLILILILGDIFLLYFSLLFTLSFRYWDFSFPFGPEALFASFLVNFSILFIFWLLLLWFLGFYKIPLFKELYSFPANLIIFIILAGLTGFAYFYLQPKLTVEPRTILILNIIVFALFFSFWRYFFKKFLEKKKTKEKIAILGLPIKFKEFFSSPLFREHYEIAAIFLPKSSSKNIVSSWGRQRSIVFNPQELKKIIKKEEISLIVLALDSYKDKKIIQDLFHNLSFKLDYLSLGAFFEKLFRKVPLEFIDEVWLWENIARNEKKLEEMIKRVFDIVFGLIGFFITLILFPLIALLIKIDSPGPVFYKQRRVGKNGKVFTLYKFRSMYVNSRQAVELWREKDPSEITKVGKVLRRFEIDEMPQFFNILKGDLSFVGPRPEWIQIGQIYEKEIPFYHYRYLIRPGLTGWAQLNYPASKSIKEAKEKFEYDLYYIKNRSFFFDLHIVFETLGLLLRKK